VDASQANPSGLPVSPALLGRLLDAHGAALTLYARQLCEAAEDVVQEALIELARQRAVPENPAAWLYRTVRNKALAAARAARRRKAHEAAAAEERAAAWFVAEPGSRLDGEAVARALASLAEEDRELVVAHLWGGLTFREAGELIGISDSAAHRRYHQALERLRAIVVGHVSNVPRP
jgi:RNA polymerase sigma-70 factor (ECF subfamily)